jgi:dihydrofolate synthase/folylpolyglutamate synthase
MLAAAGQRVGCYTSPHLLRYNERIRIAGVDAEDTALIESFERIELARGDISLTYFEFGTLAALDLFARSDLDTAVLEVGLGGRLDAVNIIDANAVIITTVEPLPLVPPTVITCRAISGAPMRRHTARTRSSPRSTPSA